MSPAALQTTVAAVLHAGKTKDLRIEQRTLFPPQPNQVQVAIVATGLCGSDLHYYQHGRNGDFAVRQDLVLGHEAAGVVTAVGSSVTNVTVGQRVAIEAGIYCRNCRYCDDDRYNLCKSMRFCSSASVFPHSDGTLQSKMNHPSFVIHPIPDSCSYERAALAEPLSVLIHASRRANLAAGHTVLVFGVGAIGLLACALAKYRCASRVVAVDINQARLDFAQENGFAEQTICITPIEKSSPEETKKDLEERLKSAKDEASGLLRKFNTSEGFDVVFECTGAEAAINMSVFAATPGGKVMLIGMGTRNAMLPLSAAACREVDILGSFRYCNTYGDAIAMLSSGELPTVDKLVTHRFPLTETKTAFDLLSQGQDDEGRIVLKVMVGSGVPS